MKNPTRPINGLTGHVLRVPPITPPDQVDIRVVHGNEHWRKGQECPVIVHELEHLD
ncbi:hypothetical protein SEA_CLARK_38 [Gordonia phage Clark]|nr:hypothetical protein PP502_gp32 [Gordonia phage Beenie]YP_010654127.1 hypothetical protein PP503_gp39 [Gordonia phage Sekhmet]YP_010654433.1 hypothetical protein PP507_gp38 [Gordonia phage Clark]YP_010654512.1 hypothetical protein PP508_gp39 [Gordonia phage Samman98]AZF93224.1 hypothetical protein SEA_ADORA_36 [Gordonia phage Adora]AUV61597.1 hypothetical protein PBI_BEENIE_32 [Gordonia phage Beenie]QDF17987.1 hypothetical protein SEA_CLARK_38 [Gordonia phage Clark]QDH93377.1 hypothetical